jgi:hypothetical protein
MSVPAVAAVAATPVRHRATRAAGAATLGRLRATPVVVVGTRAESVAVPAMAVDLLLTQVKAAATQAA